MSRLADYRHPDRVRQTLASLVPIVCPPVAVELELESDILTGVELTMRAIARPARVALLTGIHTYEHGARAYPSHRGKSASALSAAQARRYFDRWWHSPLLPQREFAKGIKGLLCLSCYEQPEMLRRIGYTADEWIARSRSYRLRTYGDAIRRHQESLLAPDPLPGIVPLEKSSEN